MARIVIWRRISLTSRKHLQYVYAHVHVRTMYLKYAPYDWLKYWGMAILVCRKNKSPPVLCFKRLFHIGRICPNPLRKVIHYGRWAVCRYFAEWGLCNQLSGTPCRTHVLVMRDFTTTCTCTCKHALLCNIYYLCMYTCTCTRMHYAAIHVIYVLVGMWRQAYTSTGPVASLKLLLWPSTVRKGF